MADSNDSTLSPTFEPKRKVSILTEHPQVQVQGYDNPAFDGPLRDGVVGQAKDSLCVDLINFILYHLCIHWIFISLPHHQQSNGSDALPMRKKSILHNPLTPEQQLQALQQVEPITQQPTSYGTLSLSPNDTFMATCSHSLSSSLSIFNIEHLEEIKNSFLVQGVEIILLRKFYTGKILRVRKFL